MRPAQKPMLNQSLIKPSAAETSGNCQPWGRRVDRRVDLSIVQGSVHKDLPSALHVWGLRGEKALPPTNIEDTIYCLRKGTTYPSHAMSMKAESVLSSKTFLPVPNCHILPYPSKKDLWQLYVQYGSQRDPRP